MEKRVCVYCGTEYDAKLGRCPLCGSVNEDIIEDTGEPEEELPEEKAPQHRRGGARVAPKEDHIPKGLSVLICVVLGLAVVIGAVYALYSLGIFSGGKSNSSVSLPLTGETTTAAVSETGKESAVACTAITLSPAETTLSEPGKTATITAAVEPSNCTQKVVWTSSNEKLCTVDENGVVLCIAAGGTVNIMATCGSQSASCTVTCGAAGETTTASETAAETTAETTAVETTAASSSGSVSLSTTDFTLFSVGETATITVKNAPSGASVTWTSSDPSVATVSNGKVTAVKKGNATITAEVNGQKLTCIARCSIKGATEATSENAENTGSYKLDHTDVTLAKGESFEISVVGGTSGGWGSSNSAICTVDAKGIVTATGSGTAKVTTTVGGQTLECIVRVK